MKTGKILSMLVLLAVASPAMADVPPPLKPVEILDPDSGKPAAPTEPAKPATPGAPKPSQPAPVQPVAKPAQPTQLPAPVAKPTQPATPVAKPAAQPTAPVVTKPAPAQPVITQPKPQPAQPVTPTKPQPPIVTSRPTVKPPPPVYQPGAVKPPPPVYRPAPPAYQPETPLATLGGFDVGQVVVTDSHLRGRIVAIFRDRRADVQFGHGIESWPLSRLSREITEIGGFAVGETVITDTRYRGVIRQVFTDRTALVQFNFGTETWPVSRLSHEIESIGGFEIGQIVVTDTHYKGRIVNVYADRTADVQFRFGTENWPLSRLGREITSLAGFMIGDVIVTDTHSRGRIAEIYADRTALIEFRHGTETWPLSRIGRPITQLRGFSVGQTVHTDTRYQGRIVEIFSDATANVQFRHGVENWPLSRLSNFYCPAGQCTR